MVAHRDKTQVVLDGEPVWMGKVVWPLESKRLANRGVEHEPVCAQPGCARHQLNLRHTAGS